MFVGIDPGMTTGGMVLLKENEIFDTASFGQKRKKDAQSPFLGDPNFGLSMLRAEECIHTIIEVLEKWSKDVEIKGVGIEGFVDLKSRKKHRDEEGQQLWIRDRWKTPLVIGMLHPYVVKYPLSYQNPAILKGYEIKLGMIKSKTMDSDTLKGWEKITSPHQASAWCHADYAQTLFTN